MSRARIVINGITGSYVEVPLNESVTVANDGDGSETSVLWVSLTGSQPSGAFDGFTDPTAASTTIQPKKEGSYLIYNIVDSSLTSSAVIAVLDLKTGLRSPAAGEKLQESGSYGWARAVQAIHDKVSDLAADPGTIIGLAKGTLERGHLVRATGSLAIKAGLPGQETIAEYANISGDVDTSFQSPLYIVEGLVTGSDTTIPSGSLAKLRRHGLFGPITGSGVEGDFVWPRSDGVISLAQDASNRKIGHIVSSDGSTFYINFDGSSVISSSIGIGVQQDGTLVSSGISTVNVTGSGGIVPTVSVIGDIATIDISGTLPTAGTNGIEIRQDGSVITTTGSIVNLTGSGGIVVSATDVGGNVIQIDVSGTVNTGTSLEIQQSGSIVTTTGSILDFTGSVDVQNIGNKTVINLLPGGLEFLDRIQVTSSIQTVTFGQGGHGLYNTLMDGDRDEEYIVISRIKNANAPTTATFQLRPNSSGSNVATETTQTSGGSVTGTAVAELRISSTTFDEIYIRTDILARLGWSRMFNSQGVANNPGAADIFRQDNCGVWDNTTDNIINLDVHCATGAFIGSGSYFDLYRRTFRRPS